ncbi:MAG: hypothetical protein ABJA98_01455 [Acidobacteriota bacterium]
MTAHSLKHQELVFIETLRDRADVVLVRASQRSLRRFVEIAVRDLEQALACLSVKNAEQTPSVLRAAARLTDLASDRIEMAEKALGEGGPNAWARR